MSQAQTASFNRHNNPKREVPSFSPFYRLGTLDKGKLAHSDRKG